jgi:hypothetical protein
MKNRARKYRDAIASDIERPQDKFLAQSEGGICDYPIDRICLKGMGEKIALNPIPIFVGIRALNVPEILL